MDSWREGFSILHGHAIVDVDVDAARQKAAHIFPPLLLLLLLRRRRYLLALSLRTLSDRGEVKAYIDFTFHAAGRDSLRTRRRVSDRNP